MTGPTSRVYEVADALEANELFQDNGWTDGLPIVPPTEDAVARFLAAAKLAADDVVGTEPVRRRRITAEKAAIAAVMAGARPEYFPVVLAIIRAMCRPEFSLHGSTASTTGMYSGRQPAMTAAIAIFSAAMRRRRTGSTPTTSSGRSRTASRKARTSDSVGGTIGSPSVQPLSW